MISISIKEKWCKGCALCADICPKKVYEIKNIGDVPKIVQLEECIGCDRCAILCPEMAITIDKEVEDI